MEETSVVNDTAPESFTNQGAESTFSDSNSSTAGRERDGRSTIPAAMKDKEQWVLWRLEGRGGKHTKVPYSAGKIKRKGILAFHEQHAKSNDSKTWSTLETCLEVWEEHPNDFSGIGYCFSDDEVGVDLDNCLLEDGTPLPWAQDILERFPDTWIERSPSGDGLHIWCRGVLVETGKRVIIEEHADGKAEAVEVYDHRSPRFFTVTGKLWKDAPTKLEKKQESLEWLNENYIAPDRKSKNDPPPETSKDEQSPHDEKKVDEALKAIPASCSRPEWFRVAAALKAGGYAFQKFHEWAEQGEDKYQGEADCKRVWDDAGKVRPGEKKITIATLFFIAREYGWKDTQQSPQEEWPEPLLFEENALPPILPTILPSPFREYAEKLSNAVQAPVAIATMLLLAVLGTACQRKFKIYVRDGWYEPVNIYTASAVGVSEGKSPVFTAITAPLDAWEERRRKEVEEENRKTDSERRVLQSRVEILQKEAARAPDEVERRAKIEEIRRLEARVPERKAIPQVHSSNATPEALEVSLEEQGGKMSILSDEGGMFEVLSGIYNDGRMNVEVCLKGWNGSRHTSNRIKRKSVYLPDPLLSFGLTVQPAVIKSFTEGSKQKFRGVGLLARFLYAVPQSMVGTREIRKASSIPAGLRDEYQSRVTELLDLKESERVIYLSLDGYEVLYDFQTYVERRLPEGQPLESIADWAGKLKSNIARVIALCHIAEYGANADKVLVSKERVEDAIAFGKVLIEHAHAVFDMMGVDPVQDDARYALQWIRGHCERDEKGAFFKESGKTGLYKAGKFKNGRMDRVRKALAILQERNIIGPMEKKDLPSPDRKGPGNKTHIRYVNPRALNLDS